MHFPWQIIILLFLFLIFAVALSGKKTKKSDLEEVQYRVRDNFFSNAERSFLGVLEGVIGRDFRVFGKVRVSDLVDAIGTGRISPYIAANSIRQKHVDFVICDRRQVNPICVIELDDNSHNSKNARERDKLKDRVFSKAGLPLVRFRVKAAYTMADVRSSLAPFLGTEIKTDLPKNLDKPSGKHEIESAEPQQLNQGRQQVEEPEKEIKIPIREKQFVKVIDMSTGFPENENPERVMSKYTRKSG